jgi:hypothetical protein
MSMKIPQKIESFGEIVRYSIDTDPCQILLIVSWMEQGGVP